jgi:hypothetical protein
MRAKAHKFEAVVIRLAVDENEIRPEVAVAVIVPFAGQWVIEVSSRQRRVGGEQVDHLHQQGVQLLAVPAGFFSPVVTLKAGGVFNFPHSGFAAVCPACRP